MFNGWQWAEVYLFGVKGKRLRGVVKRFLMFWWRWASFPEHVEGRRPSQKSNVRFFKERASVGGIYPKSCAEPPAAPSRPYSSLKNGVHG